MRNDYLRDEVSVRSTIAKSKWIRIYISIGINLGKLLNFEPHSMVRISRGENNKNLILIKKSEDSLGATLSYNRGNFLVTSARMPINDGIKEKSKIIADYKILDNNQLLLDISNLIERK